MRAKKNATPHYHVCGNQALYFTHELGALTSSRARAQYHCCGWGQSRKHWGIVACIEGRRRISALFVSCLQCSGEEVPEMSEGVNIVVEPHQAEAVSQGNESHRAEAVSQGNEPQPAEAVPLRNAPHTAEAVSEGNESHTTDCDSRQ